MQEVDFSCSFLRVKFVLTVPKSNLILTGKIIIECKNDNVQNLKLSGGGGGGGGEEEAFWSRLQRTFNF